jgi:hypothetical protein
VDVTDIADSRLDAWFHQHAFLAADELLRRNANLIQVKSLCDLPKEAADFSKWPSDAFTYFEIGGLNAETGEAIPVELRPGEAPSRAKYLVVGGDVLVSTVRPNLRAIGQVSFRYSRAVCSSGFCILRSEEPAIGAYVRMCLVQDAATMQLMRWNTGGTYPAIERSVPGLVLIPNLGQDRIREIGQDLLNANRHTEEVSECLRSAIADVEALVTGALDVAATVTEGDQIEHWLNESESKRREREIACAQ